MAPQLAALGDWEQQFCQQRGHVGPDLSLDACRGASVFHEADQAACVEAGNIPGSYMRIDGFDAPEWQQYIA